MHYILQKVFPKWHVIHLPASPVEGCNCLQFTYWETETQVVLGQGHIAKELADLCAPGALSS